MRLPNWLKRKPQGRKVFVLGLDCAAPELVFERWVDDLPNLQALRQRGLWGELDSCIPAITVPAWSSMLSSKDPGTLGIYGFRNRADHSYDKFYIASSGYVREKRIWDYLGQAGKSSLVIGVPQTYPVQPLQGHLISGFLTPSRKSNFAYPPELKGEVLRLAPEYDFDVPQFRTDDKDWLLAQILDMTRKRFRLVDHLLANKPWDFFMLMEIGVDRIHHGFWSYHDPAHRRYEPGNRFENAIHDYYVEIDQKLGQWLGKLDDEAVILVVSDHGAKSMQGGICINEWLIEQGYLKLKQPPETGKLTRFEDLEVDWANTTAWGSGGYYGRLFMNVAGREPQGIVPAQDYERIRQQLADEISAIPDPDGNALDTRIHIPQQIYKQVNGVAPDLMIYFDDLRWRSVGSLGHSGIHIFENDTGPDDCNHAQNGMFIYVDPQLEQQGQEVHGAQLMDIAPTILASMGLPIPDDFQGRRLAERPKAGGS